MIEEKRNVRALVFVKIELDGLTLRFCNEHAVATDDDGATYFWEGRLKDIAPITAGFNDFRESNSLVSSTSITLWNGKSSRTQSNLDSLVDGYFWGRKKVTVHLVEEVALTSADTLEFWRVGDEQYVGDEKMIGPTWTGRESTFVLDASTLVFKGVIGFPDIFKEHNDEILSFAVYDERYNDQLPLAKNTIESGPVNVEYIFTSLGSGVEGRTVPVIYGDFSSDNDLPCYLVNTSTRKFQLADYLEIASGQSAIKEITEVYRNGSAVTETQDLNTASFTIPAYTTGDIITVSAKGLTRGTQIASVFGGSSADLLEHPIEVIYDLLVNRLGVNALDIDTASFINAYNEDTTKKCRRWVSDKISIVTLLNDLAFEFGVDLFNLNGKFQCKILLLATASPIESFEEDDILGRSYTSRTDPNRAYFNAFSVNYAPDYQNNILKSATVFSNPAKISLHGITQTLSLNMKWNHLESSVAERFGALLYIFQNPVTHVEFTGMYRAFSLKPTDVVTFNFHKFSSQNIIIRNISRDLKTFQTSITAWFLGEIPLKNWADAEGNPADYEAAQAAEVGTYHGELEIISGFNDRIRFSLSGVSRTASLTPGLYSEDSLGTHIGTQMDAAASVSGFTCVFNSVTNKWALSYSSSFNLEFQSWVTPPTTEAEKARGREIFNTTLGFDTSANKTGASSYSSDYICLFDDEVASVWG